MPNGAYEIRELGIMRSVIRSMRRSEGYGYLEVRDEAVNITVLNASEAMAKLHLDKKSSRIVRMILQRRQR